MHRIPDVATEERIEALRREAELYGRVGGEGVRPQGSPMPQVAPAKPSAQTGYYGLPLLKGPVWSEEIPIYFFVGGAAGAAAVIGAIARITGADEKLVRDARWMAAIGANLSAPLLIADLGRPERFLAMMRVFKPQSPMSVGAWTLALFGATATTAAIADEVGRRTDLPVKFAADTTAMVSAAAGLGMATYTGVLLGATSIPAWAKHARTLPAHFAASGLAAAVSMLQLGGHEGDALNALAIAAAMFETYTGAEIELDRGRDSEPLRHGPTGLMTRAGGVLSGPVPLLLRLLGGRSKRMRRVAAVSSILGSLITRFAWVEVGKVSARDPRIPVGLA